MMAWIQETVERQQTSKPKQVYLKEQLCNGNELTCKNT